MGRKKKGDRGGQKERETRDERGQETGVDIGRERQGTEEDRGGQRERETRDERVILQSHKPFEPQICRFLFLLCYIQA